MDESPKYLFVAYSNNDYEQIDSILLELYKHRIAAKDATDTTASDIDTII